MDITVLTDASFCPNHKVAGYGFWIACERGKAGGGGSIVSEVDDTNSAEMMAICNALWHGVMQELILPSDRLLIQTDSLAAIDRLSGQRPVTFTKQQERVSTYYQELIYRLELDVRFRHVKGHSCKREARFVANRMCDKRAKEHMRRARCAKIAQPHLQAIQELLND